MCGIAGAYWSGTKPDSAAAVIDRMVAAISHRGPDSDGRSSSQFADIGFKRLSIIDLATGDQPLSNEDGTIECFLNGEIYNYRSLRAELLERGHTFKTSSDTEVLPHLYEELGEKMFAKLNGMFSICVIDHPHQTVLLARDHFGVKQMYYAQAGRAVVFGSEMKAVLASGLFEPELDTRSILPYLTMFYSPEPHTLVKGVKKIPAGSFIKFQQHRDIQLTKYYELPYEPRVMNITEEEAAEHATELLEQSISLQLQADVPVGISLSGGLDSSAIASLACRSKTAPSHLMALTISWPDTAPEEVSCSQELCRRLGLQQEIIQPSKGNFETDLPLLAWMSDEPIADPATYSQYRVAQSAGQWVKVLLGGAGGDELFGGYGSYVLSSKKALFASLPPVIQRAAQRAFVASWLDEESADALVAYKDSRFLWHSKVSKNLGIADEDLLKRALPDSRPAFDNFRQLFKSFGNYDAANQQMLVDLRSYLPEQVLPMMDRATMAASVEGRVPFLDVPLVEFCYSLPGSLKLGRPAVQKRLLKRALANFVPKEVVKRKKSGMPSHFAVFMSEHPEVVRQLLLAKDGCAASLLPRTWLEGLVSSPERMRSNFRILYPLVVLEVWNQLFIKERTYDRPKMALSELFRLSSKVMAAVD